MPPQRTRAPLNQRHRDQPPFLSHDGGDEKKKGATGPRKMQPPRRAVRVLAQVERVEIAEGAKFFAQCPRPASMKGRKISVCITFPCSAYGDRATPAARLLHNK